MLSVEGQHKIEDLLLTNKLLNKEQLEDSKVEALKESKPLISYIAEKELVGEEDLTRISAQAMGVPYANLSQLQVPEEIGRMLPRETAETYMAVPFGMQQGRLAVGMLDPTNIQAVDFLSRKTGHTLTVYLVSRASVDHILGQFRSDVAADLATAMDVADRVICMLEGRVVLASASDSVSREEITQAYFGLRRKGAARGAHP